MARNKFFLEVNPFPIGTTDTCFVSTPALRLRLERTLREVREGERPICIAAPEGSGKSTLLGQVRGDLGPQWRIAMISGATGLDRESFLEAFGSAFGLPPGEDETLAAALERLENHLSVHLAPDETALVIVDDADFPSARTRVRFDALLARRQSPRLRFITAREPTPEGPGDGCGGAPHSLVDIPPLARAQSDDYIHTRLCAAGLRGDSPFSDDMLRSIHSASGGRPGGIHRVAAKMLANRRRPGRGGGRAGSRRAPWSRIVGLLRPKKRSSRA